MMEEMGWRSHINWMFILGRNYRKEEVKKTNYEGWTEREDVVIITIYVGCTVWLGVLIF